MSCGCGSHCQKTAVHASQTKDCCSHVADRLQYTRQRQCIATSMPGAFARHGLTDLAENIEANAKQSNKATRDDHHQTSPLVSPCSFARAATKRSSCTSDEKRRVVHAPCSKRNDLLDATRELIDMLLQHSILQSQAGSTQTSSTQQSRQTSNESRNKQYDSTPDARHQLLIVNAHASTDNRLHQMSSVLSIRV